MSHDNVVEIFTYAGENEVRVVMTDGNPWFCATDVCTVLAHTNSRMAVTKLDPDEKTTIRVERTAGQGGSVNNSYGTLGGNPNMIFISESGLYSLIMRSNKPHAKAFRRWVTHDVLPTIRRTGRYTPATSENMDALLSRAIGSIADLADRTGDLTKAVEINTLAVARLTAGLPPVSTDPPPTSETHSETPVLHSDIHRVIHRSVQLPTAGDRRRLSAEVVAECRRRARDGVSVYRLAREHSVSDSTMRAAVRGQTYRYVPEPPASP
ncbi:BRO family protein [Embleya sp. NBC_00896]|uniref:BRO family protein n=1 Tax=Embleya sp. NBC_00896 TaxID=2975961 RepID=UPI00386BE134|nr:BRO family protein [Embleya sp. NBC_00896]